MECMNESAVSPVIGVMLMLVVTIIIAAVVSAFAGGMTGTETNAPQAVIQGTYSLSSDILQLHHAGGDQLSTQKIIITIQQNDEDFGGYMSLFTQMGTGAGLIIANKSCISNSDGECWLDATTGSVEVPVFRPGETMYYTDVIKKNIVDLDPVGKSLILKVSTTDGKLISKSKVMIDP
ncbi:MAG: type IV pilin N-terminal domain-containing protein [Candidatus Methanoculleus thermohydrogenotrophicum]